MTANPGESAAEAQTPRRGRVPSDTFSVRLLLARHLAGMGIKEAAEACGLHYATWSTWEAGRRPRDLVEVCERVAQGLDVDFNWLLLGGPLEGPRGRVVTKRLGTFREPYVGRSKRPIPDRPKVREDPARPIYPQAGQPRRANRVNIGRTADAMYAA